MKVKTLLNTIWYGIDVVDIYIGKPDRPEFMSSITIKEAVAAYGDFKVKKFNQWLDKQNEKHVLDILI